MGPKTAQSEVKQCPDGKDRRKVMLMDEKSKIKNGCDKYTFSEPSSEKPAKLPKFDVNNSNHDLFTYPKFDNKPVRVEENLNRILTSEEQHCVNSNLYHFGRFRKEIAPILLHRNLLYRIDGERAKRRRKKRTIEEIGEELVASRKEIENSIHQIVFRISYQGLSFTNEISNGLISHKNGYGCAIRDLDDKLKSGQLELELVNKHTFSSITVGSLKFSLNGNSEVTNGNARRLTIPAKVALPLETSQIMSRSSDVFALSDSLKVTVVLLSSSGENAKSPYKNGRTTGTGFQSHRFSWELPLSGVVDLTSGDEMRFQLLLNSASFYSSGRSKKPAHVIANLDKETSHNEDEKPFAVLNLVSVTEFVPSSQNPGPWQKSLNESPSKQLSLAKSPRKRSPIQKKRTTPERRISPRSARSPSSGGVDCAGSSMSRSPNGDRISPISTKRSPSRRVSPRGVQKVLPESLAIRKSPRRSSEESINGCLVQTLTRSPRRSAGNQSPRKVTPNSRNENQPKPPRGESRTSSSNGDLEGRGVSASRSVKRSPVSFERRSPRLLQSTRRSPGSQSSRSIKKTKSDGDAQLHVKASPKSLSPVRGSRSSIAARKRPSSSMSAVEKTNRLSPAQKKTRAHSDVSSDATRPKTEKDGNTNSKVETDHKLNENLPRSSSSNNFASKMKNDHVPSILTKASSTSERNPMPILKPKDFEVKSEYKNATYNGAEDKQVNCKYIFLIGCRTETLESSSYSCLWCNIKETSIQSLLIHYSTFHQSYNFTLFKQTTKSKAMPLVIVDIAKYDRNAELSSKSFFFHKPRLNCNSETGSNDQNNFVAKQNYLLARVNQMFKKCDSLFTTNCEFFSSRTARYLPEFQQKWDSDEESVNLDWQETHMARQIDDFMDVSSDEKRLMNMWNKHRFNYGHVSGNTQVISHLVKYI